MTHLLKSCAAALALAALAAGPAQALDLQAGGAPKLKPTAAQLGIISPPGNACPGTATLTAWVHTNVPGTVDILLVRKNGNVAGPYAVTTVEGASGGAMGSYARQLNIVAPIDAEYRVVIPNSTVVSNWVPLVAHC